MNCTNSIVADGHARAYSAAEPNIRAEVERVFAARLAVASFWKRWWLRRQMEREIARRIDLVAPKDALYAMHSR